MIAFLRWYLISSLIGWLVFPLVYRLFSSLPSRGYYYSRIFGLLLWGYGFWFLGSIGFLRNNVEGNLFVLGSIAAAGVWTGYKTGWDPLRSWLKNHTGVIISSELIFLAGFALWTFVRSANPEIAGTEKPMELAFINAIRQSGQFPPHDPWLSGYAISYYYFGYMIIASLMQISGVGSGIAFNLGIALVFALVVVASYGIVYDLLSLIRPIKKPERGIFWISLLGPLNTALMGNLGGLFEVFYSRRFFWQANPDGSLSSTFWTWLGIKEMDLSPVAPISWMPNRNYIWWWRSSRVVQDFNLAGKFVEVIDEFPFFSFLLGDLHPHVLALPFALLAIALSLNLFVGRIKGGVNQFKFSRQLSASNLLFPAIIIGGLAFLNTWDFPIYICLFAGGYALAGLHTNGWAWARVREFAEVSLLVLLSGIVAYLPFYVGFSSQAGGFLPNLINPTRGTHLWVMFGLLFLPIFSFLLYVVKVKKIDPGLYWRSALVALSILISFLFLALSFGFVILKIPVVGELFMDLQGDPGAGIRLIFQSALLRRWENPGGWITLAGLMTVLSLIFWSWNKQDVHPESFTRENRSVPVLFVLGLISIGVLLVIFPEFFYLRDQFNTRMNTVFKFYYQAWLLWGLSAAFACAVLMRSLRGYKAFLLRFALMIVVLVGLVYPVTSVWFKTNGFKSPTGFQLDGTVLNQDDRSAVDWLDQAPFGVVAEAVGGSYSPAGHARISEYSGFPTVIGWPGHESQWRGRSDELGSRQSDIDLLYRTVDWGQAESILEKYSIRYVVVGSLERSTYLVNERLFKTRLETVFRQGDTAIYLYDHSFEALH